MPIRVPVVLSRDEVGAILRQLTSKMWIIVVILYGAGLRIQDCLELRIKDIDFDRHQIEIGEAVLELCKPRMERRDVEVRSVPVRGHSQGVNLAGQGEVHSTWEQVYFWSRNCLRASYELTVEELASAKSLIEEKIAERKTP